jgi:hypothetical protein
MWHVKWKEKRQKKLNGGQLLLTVTDKRQTRPLVREGAPQRQDSKIQTELISGRKSHSGFDTKTYSLTHRQSYRDFSFSSDNKHLQTGYRMNQGSFYEMGEYLCPLHSAQTWPEVHTAFCLTGTGDWGVKLTAYLYLAPSSRMVELYFHFYIRLHGVVLNSLSAWRPLS